MNTTLLNLIVTAVIGTSITIAGATLPIEDILGDAVAAVSAANLHQFATVIELYYADHGIYPQVSGGDALVELLAAEDYIINRPLDPSVFLYGASADGQEYHLALR